MKSKLIGAAALMVCAGCATPDAYMVSSDARTQSSKELVLAFFDEVLLGGDLTKAENYLRKDYIQHNPQIPGGLDGFVSYFTEVNGRLEQLNATISGEVEHVVAEGDMVMVVVRYKIKGPIEVNFRAADLFRVQDGLIAEHWDVRQGDTLRDHQILMQN